MTAAAVAADAEATQPPLSSGTQAQTQTHSAATTDLAESTPKKHIASVELTVVSASVSPNANAGGNTGADESSSSSSNYMPFELHTDIYTIFIADWYHNGVYSAKLLTAVCLTVSVQLFALFALSLAYISEWENQRVQNTSTKLRLNSSVFSYAPVHVLCMAAGIVMLFGYVLNSLSHFSSLMLAINHCSAAGFGRDCIDHKKNDQIENKSNNSHGRRRQQRLWHFRISVLLSMLNIGIAVSTFFFSIVITMTGMYWKVEQPSEILFSSIGAVFILEFDDWIGEWFTNGFKQTQSLEIPVLYEPFLSQLKVFQGGFGLLLVLVAIGQLSMALRTIELGVETGSSYHRLMLFLAYICTIFVLVICGCIFCISSSSSWLCVCCTKRINLNKPQLVTVFWLGLSFALNAFFVIDFWREMFNPIHMYSGFVKQLLPTMPVLTVCVLYQSIVVIVVGQRQEQHRQQRQFPRTMKEVFSNWHHICWFVSIVTIFAIVLYWRTVSYQLCWGTWLVMPSFLLCAWYYRVAQRAFENHCF